MEASGEREGEEVGKGRVTDEETSPPTALSLYFSLSRPHDLSLPLGPEG